jgi:hypothetical protein
MGRLSEAYSGWLFFLEWLTRPGLADRSIEVHPLWDPPEKLYALRGLTPLVFSEEWKKEKDLLLCSDTSMFQDGYGLPLKRLKKAFQTLRKQEIGRLCLFIDGLDDRKAISWKLSNSYERLLPGNLKLCLSSRPWPVFENLFACCQNSDSTIWHSMT